MRAIYSFLIGSWLGLAALPSVVYSSTKHFDVSFCNHYYSNISLEECRELTEIKRHYSSYGPKYKHLALARVKQIQQKFLSLDDRGEIILREIDNAYFGDLPIEVTRFVLEQFKQFRALSREAKLELIKDRLIIQDQGSPLDTLSDEAVNYKNQKALMLSQTGAVEKI